jgi:hypothetical protein
MTLTIEFPAELEEALQQRAAEAGKDVVTYVMDAIVEQIEVDAPSAVDLSPEEFKRRLHEIIEKHGVHCGHVDDSRESIYAGRGE